MTGGEPLVRKNDILKLAEKHDDCVFMIFTNGTLIDQKFCEDLCKITHLSARRRASELSDGHTGNSVISRQERKI